MNSGDITVTLKQAFAEAVIFRCLQWMRPVTISKAWVMQTERQRGCWWSIQPKPFSPSTSTKPKSPADSQKKTISIVLPEPQAELNVDYGKAEILAKKQFFSPLVGTEDEMLSQIISQNEMTKSAETALGKELMESARDAARSQVYALCQNLSDGTYRIEESNITFRTEGA